MKKRILSALMALAMALTLLPASVLGAGAAPGEAEVTSAAYTLPDDGASSDELLLGYLEQQTFGGGISLFANYGEDYFADDANALKAYQALKDGVKKIASGSTDSSVITISSNDIEGVVKNREIFDVLLDDCPFEMYWCDKLHGVSTAGSGYNNVGTITYTFAVSQDYAKSGSTTAKFGDDQCPVQLDTSKTRATSTVVTNAKAIVNGVKGNTPDARMAAYKNKICELVSYNKSAADNKDTPYGDPWQLIHVFDHTTANGKAVVCEGYAKAFQYLCDLDGGLECYTVSGKSSTGKGAGDHMWNIVTMEDGKNYLVDVTNSDQGSIGQDGKSLFLAGTSGSPSSGYTFSIPGQDSMTYTYDSDTKDTYGSSILTLATSSYTPGTVDPGEQLLGIWILDAQGKRVDEYADNDGTNALPVFPMKVGESATFTAFVHDAEPEEEVSGKTVTWSRALDDPRLQITPNGNSVTVKLLSGVKDENCSVNASLSADNYTINNYVIIQVADDDTPVEKLDAVIDTTPVTVPLNDHVPYQIKISAPAEGGPVPTGRMALVHPNSSAVFAVEEVEGVGYYLRGKRIGNGTLTITYDGDDNYNSATATVNVTVSNKQPVAESVNITAESGLMQTLEAYTDTELKAEAVNSKEDAGTLTYQWYRDGKAIDGATTNTYKVTPADADNGAKLTVRVTGTSDKYIAQSSDEVTAVPIIVNFGLTVMPNKVKLGGTAKAMTTATSTRFPNVEVEDYTVTYGSSNPMVANVGVGGEVHILQTGKTTFTATFHKPGYAANDATADFEVLDKDPVTIDVAESVSKTYGDEAFNLDASFKGEEGAALEGVTATYTPDNTGVVEVAADGTVTIKKAGKCTVTIKATHPDYADSEKTVTINVAKKTITIASATLNTPSKVYDGSDDAGKATVVFTGVKTGDTVEYTTICVFKDVNAGENKDVTVDVDLDNNNYTLGDATTTTTKGTITKATTPDQGAAVTLGAAEPNNSLDVELPAFLPEDCGGTPTYTLQSGATGAVLDGTSLRLTYVSDGTEAGVATVEVGGMQNYENFKIGVSIQYTTKQVVRLTINTPDLTYDGSRKDVTVTGAPNGVTPVIEYWQGGTKLDGAPKDAGTYKVRAYIPDDNATYAGVASATFEIKPANVIVTADDKTILAGQPLPEFTYTPKIDGVTVTCPSAVDNNNLIGDYPIRISGPAKSADGNYTYSYVGGTLYVSAINVPTASPKGGSYTGGRSVTLTADSGATIYYTTDGTTPTTSSTQYTRAISLPNTTKTTTIKAIAVKNGATSGVMTEVYNITASSKPSGGGSSGGGGGSTTPTNPSVTVPVSGDQSSIRVDATVSGSTATVTEIDLNKMGNVIGDDVRTGMVEIDFSGLDKTINTVKLPTDAIGEIADAAKSSRNDVDGLTVKLSTGEVSFDGTALAAIESQAGSSITLTVSQARTSDLNARQREKVGSAPVYDLTLKSGSKNITRFNDGLITVSLPYTLKAGEDASRITVYYLDDSGNIQACETMYNVRTKSVIFTTTHLSLYYIGVADSALVVENIPSSGMAQASTQSVEVDGQKVEFQMYALLDANGNATNYIKLRDLAHVLNGTKAPFSVGYSAETGITVTTGQPYQDNGSEMTTPFSGARAYTGGAQSVQINGKPVAMTAITLLDDNGGGYNYFKLRDLGIALGFNVSWTAERGIFVETDKPYVG